MLEKDRYYQCRYCGRTYRCRIAKESVSACGHPAGAQRETTEDDYKQIRMGTYRDLARMEKQNRRAREAAESCDISVTNQDDAVSIFGKAIGLKKREVIRIFSEIGWQLYRRQKREAGPVMDDVDFFNGLVLLVALARGIPRSLQMEIHPKFGEYLTFFTLAIHQFAYCYPSVNYCSQRGLCWLFDGLDEVLGRRGEQKSALLEAEEILRKSRGR